MRIAITGGGTGGHIYPALSIAEILQEQNSDWDITFFGQKHSLEGTLIPQRGYKFEHVSAYPLARKLHPRLLIAGARVLQGLGQAIWKLRRYQPDIVVGTGGYVAGPVMLAALVLKFPTLIHEQNAFPGVTNRILSKYVHTICLSFEETREHCKGKGRIVVTGNPVRQSILRCTQERGRSIWGVSPEQKLLLIMGGSQGARSINEGVVQWLSNSTLPGEWVILHVTGRGQYQETLDLYRKYGIEVSSAGHIIVRDYVEDVETAYAAAHLFLGRSGAMTVAELTARGLPAVLIPYPYAAEDHQRANARMMEKNGGAILINDRDIKEGKLGVHIEDLLVDDKKIDGMALASLSLGHPQAIDKIHEEILRLVSSNR